MVATECKLVLPDYVFIGIQLLIYIPLSLVRKIKHFSSTSIVADIFILLGLGYIVYLNIIHLFINGPATDIQMFNLKSFPLFIGTALFAFEGICLVLPIEQSMKHPEKFKPVLTLCVITIGFIFIIVGMLGYIAFGSKVETNVFLNLPNDSPVVSIIQFLYAISIILTFPLTVYPAIRIIETGIFGPSSGKSSTLIKWQKNGIRSTTIIILALVAIFGTDNLDSFVSLVGCFACIPLVFIYPAYFHSFIAKSRLVYFKDFGIVVVGFIAMAYNCWVTVKQMVDGSKDLPRNRCFPNFEGGAIL